jgi:hypothetical protein
MCSDPQSEVVPLDELTDDPVVDAPAPVVLVGLVVGWVVMVGPAVTGGGVDDDVAAAGGEGEGDEEGKGKTVHRAILDGLPAAINVALRAGASGVRSPGRPGSRPPR